MIPGTTASPKRTALKQAARAGWLILSRTLALTAFGVILNWGLFAALGMDIWGRYCAAGNAAPHVSSGPGAILVLFILGLACSRAVILTAVFLFVFPFLYFMVGKTRGIKKAVASLTLDNRAWIHDMLNPVLQSALEAASKDAGKDSKRGKAKSVASFLKRRLDQTEGLPRPLRWLVNALLKKLKVTQLIEEMNALKRNGSGSEAVAGQIRLRIDREIDDKAKIGWFGAGLLFGHQCGMRRSRLLVAPELITPLILEAHSMHRSLWFYDLGTSTPLFSRIS